MKNIQVKNTTWKELRKVRDELGFIHYGKTIKYLIDSYKEHRTEMPNRNPRLKIKSLECYGKIDSDWRDRALERADYTSEISGGRCGSPIVHHIISATKFLSEAIDFLFKGCFDFDLEQMFILDWDVIPDIIFEEMHHRHNLVVLNSSEHGQFEGMSRTFFHAVRCANMIEGYQ